MKKILSVSTLIFSALSFAQISPDGLKLRAALDSADVSHHWIAGQHVDWQTGDPDGKPVSAAGVHSHCSAFVAAFAQKMGVYILRPPQHSQILLANAQADWLQGEGKSQGWKSAKDGIEAQHLANQGFLVIASYKDPNGKPGHIAIVRPDDKSDEEILEKGPQVTQAGEKNYKSTNLKYGFRYHPAAWQNGEVIFYWHAVKVIFYQNFKRNYRVIF